MALRCRKKPLLCTLLAMITLSVSVCFYTAVVLTGEEEATNSRFEQPGLRPLKFTGSNRQREILNVNSDASVAHRLREEMAELERSKIGEPYSRLARGQVAS